MINELCHRIWSRNKFHEDFVKLQEAYLQRLLIQGGQSEGIAPETIANLLQCAITFSAANESQFKNVAYRIATAAAELGIEDYPGSLYALLIVLSRIGNFPALDFAENRFEISEYSLPIRALHESLVRAQENTIFLQERQIRLTDFQSKLWRSLVAGKSVGISAPTSAGKSFVMQQYVRSKLVEKKVNRVGFLVPSRALINQVSQDVSEWLSLIKSTDLVTTPIPPEIDLPDRAVFVVTQERMQLLQMSHSDLAFDILVVDEAQGLGDGPRGIVLSSVIEEAINRNKDVQLMFAGPNLDDPGSLGNVFGVNPLPVKTNDATVSQNLVFLDSVRGKPKLVKVSVLSEGIKRELGQLELNQSLRGYQTKLVNLALRFGNGGQSLVYAKGTKDCENIAFQLADRDEVELTAHRRELSEFIKDAVHPKYSMVSTVMKGIGFHYGRLPSLVRKSVEDAFSDGVLNTLVTTSTLLQGVNLPAQNLFLCQPQRGPSQPIGSIDFWNLAGRAGRLGKEFSGNIFLIDYDEWQSAPIEGEREKSVTPSIKDHVVLRTDELIEYINDVDRKPKRNEDDELENTFVKLVRDKLRGNLYLTFDRVGLVHQREKLASAIDQVVAGSMLEEKTIEASPTVSLHRQQRLYCLLSRDLENKGVEHVVPRHPLDGDAYPSYSRAIKRLHDTVLGYPSEDRSHRYFALVILKWINGNPLPSIIDDKFEYKRKTGNPNLASVIRETLKEIESDLRHKYVRLFSCYNAVLEQVLRDFDNKEAIASIPPLPTFLEVGACTSTMISFMGVGLSRYTSGKLSNIVRRKDLNQSEARTWLKGQDVEALDIPAASIKEIYRMLSL